MKHQLLAGLFSLTVIVLPVAANPSLPDPSLAPDPVVDKARFRTLQPVSINPEYVYVRFRSATLQAVRQQDHARARANVVWESRLIPGLAMVRVEAGHERDAILTYLDSDAVLYAEPNYRVEPTVIPDDVEFSELWGLHNTGQTVHLNNSGTSGIDMDAPSAWEVTTGDPELKIAVIDSGLNFNHPDIAGNVWTNPGEIPGNEIDDDENGYVDDVHGYNVVQNNGDILDWTEPCFPHGTHVSGTIGARGNNGIGVTGVAWNCKIVMIKTGLGNCVSLDFIPQAIEYALTVGCKISNNSYGTQAFAQSMYDMVALANTMDHLFVAASGNETTNTDGDPRYPAAFDLPNVISVMNINNESHKYPTSNWGFVSVDVAAPGDDILSLGHGSGYLYATGTSMSSPQVAGLAALIRSRYPQLTHLEVRRIVLSTARRLPSLKGLCATEGLVNAYDAVTAYDRDCNANGIPDGQEILAATVQDCNQNFIPDSCELDSIDVRAMRFDGAHTQINCGNNANLNLISDFTVEAWASTNEPGVTASILSNGPFSGYGFGVNSGRLLLNKYGVSPVLTSAVHLAAGQRRHLAAVVHGDHSVSFYVDGDFVENVAGGGPVQSATEEMVIGRRVGSAEPHWNGLIDEVRIWNVARSASDIRADHRRRLAGNEPGLVALWSLNEGSGTAVADAAGGDNNGVATTPSEWIRLSGDIDANNVPDACQTDCNDDGIPNVIDFNRSEVIDFTESRLAYRLNGSAVRGSIAVFNSPSLRLTTTQNSQTGTILLEPTTGPVQEMFGSFDFVIGGGLGAGADGLGVSLLNADVHGPDALFGENGPPGDALTLEFDTHQNPGEINGNHVTLWYNGTEVSTVTLQIPIRGGLSSPRHVDFNLNSDGTFSAYITTQEDGTDTIFKSVPIPGFTPFVARIGFGSRTGGLNDQHWVDNINLGYVASTDCDQDSIPDICQLDCNDNGIGDSCELLTGATDCDNNGLLDECDAALPNGDPVLVGSEPAIHGFVDITALPTVTYIDYLSQPGGGQLGYENINMPFSSSVFDSALRVSNFGSVGVGITSGTTPTSPWPMPTIQAFGGAKCIAPWWYLQDIQGSISYDTIGTAPDRTFILQWTNRRIALFGNPGTVTFQVQIFEHHHDGIWAQYLYEDTTTDGSCNNGACAGIGYQSHAGSGNNWTGGVTSGTVLSVKSGIFDCDNDGVLDTCEPDTDGDGILDECNACPGFCDNCPTVPNADQADCDDDGIGDACETDTDMDGVVDDCDNCPMIANSDQADCNSDGIGNACDSDTDGDGVIDGCDNCPLVANADQADCNNDGIGDVCDPEGDTDSDGLQDGCDNCPAIANPDQVDCDNNGVGDVCEPGATDCNDNGIPDSCDSRLAFSNTLPPVNGFIDISTTGEVLNLGDDATTVRSLGFVTPIFPGGQIDIGNNGFICTPPAGQDDNYDNIPFPNTILSTAVVLAPLWDDLANGPGEVYYQVIGNSPDRVAIIQWHELRHFYANHPATFQAQIFESNPDDLLAQFVYVDVHFNVPALDYGASATIGGQLSQDQGTTWSHFNASLADGMVLSVWWQSSDVDHNGILDECESCITCPGDVNGDDAVNGRDIMKFVNCLFGTGNCVCADMNGINGVTVDDVEEFVNDLLAGAGCP
jgi:subtilisin family serine protease